MGLNAKAGVRTGLATLCLVAVLLSLSIGDGDPRSADGSGKVEVLVIGASGHRRTQTVETIPSSEPSTLTSSIRAAIPERDIELRSVRLVDADWGIACGERSTPGSAALRRFVWLGHAGIVVTDDGGPDFANLAFVCDPSRPVVR